MRKSSWFLKFGSILIFIGNQLLGADAPSPVINAKIYCLSLGMAVTGLNIINQDNKDIPIAIPDNFLSLPYIYRGPAKLKIYKTIFPSPGDPQASKGPVHEI